MALNIEIKPQNEINLQKDEKMEEIYISIEKSKASYILKMYLMLVLSFLPIQKWLVLGFSINSLKTKKKTMLQENISIKNSSL